MALRVVMVKKTSLHLRGRWQGSALTEGVPFRVLPQLPLATAPSRKEPIESEMHHMCESRKERSDGIAIATACRQSRRVAPLREQMRGNT